MNDNNTMPEGCGGAGALISLVMIGIFGAMIGGWVTHLIVCFTEERWGFLIAGAIFFPVAIVHGIGRWFGAW